MGLQIPLFFSLAKYSRRFYYPAQCETHGQLLSINKYTFTKCKVHRPALSHQRTTFVYHMGEKCDTLSVNLWSIYQAMLMYAFSDNHVLPARAFLCDVSSPVIIVEQGCLVKQNKSVLFGLLNVLLLVLRPSWRNCCLLFYSYFLTSDFSLTCEIGFVCRVNQDGLAMSVFHTFCSEAVLILQVLLGGFFCKLGTVLTPKTKNGQITSQPETFIT